MRQAVRAAARENSMPKSFSRPDIRSAFLVVRGTEFVLSYSTCFFLYPAATRLKLEADRAEVGHLETRKEPKPFK